jgi:glutathione synthase/RimK-type ligase-like ATP-grasp enzyme
MGLSNKELPVLGFLYLDYVLRFFDYSNFKGWPNKIEEVTYHWKNDKARFIKEVKRKKIDVLIGNIPATAYETFREISRELPDVRFIPSLDTQFSNKSKENVTRFAWKYNLPIPKTYIHYNKDEAYKFLKSCEYPKIIKQSYGPGNYGGKYVHKADSFKEAKEIFAEKKYNPMYFQDFVPMEADIRVMLIGHKPVCAFWRRAPEGEWLTNTSQGGSMDYMDVPKNVLDLAVKVSKAANAEYWACDIAYGKDGKIRILECATAFAAFPYIRDWIGQYLMWSLSKGRFRKPYIPIFNWEQLGKIDSSFLRTMRNIQLGKYSPSFDGAYYIDNKKSYGDAVVSLSNIDNDYPMYDIIPRIGEEWTSEEWDFQSKVFFKKSNNTLSEEEVINSFIGQELSAEEVESDEQTVIVTEEDLKKILMSIPGLTKKKFDRIINDFETAEAVIGAIEQNVQVLLIVKGIGSKMVEKISERWETFKIEGK